VEQKGTVVLTAANKDRRLLNESIRAELIQTKQLPAGQAIQVQDAAGKTSTKDFSVGDKMIFLQNDSRLGVQNGQTVEVIKLEEKVMTVKSGEKEIVIDLDKYNKIDHGYALTSHKAQGISVDRALINLDSSQKQLNNRNMFYVDISRARQEVKVFMDDKEKIAGQIRDFVTKVSSEEFLISRAMGSSTRREPQITKSSDNSPVQQKSRTIEDGPGNSVEKSREDGFRAAYLSKSMMSRGGDSFVAQFKSLAQALMQAEGRAKGGLEVRIRH